VLKEAGFSMFGSSASEGMSLLVSNCNMSLTSGSLDLGVDQIMGSRNDLSPSTTRHHEELPNGALPFDEPVQNACLNKTSR
jgi:hypothetical protein